MLKNIYFADPEFLIILIIIPFAIFFWFKFGKITQATLRHPSLSLLKLNNSLISKLRPFLNIFRIIVILLLSIGCFKTSIKVIIKKN